MLSEVPGPETPLSRSALVGAIITFLAGQHPRTLVAMRESLEQEIDEAGPDALARLGERLARDGADWAYYPSDPLAKRIHHVLAERILKPGSVLLGLENLEAVAGRPVVIFANHLSYSDANLLEVLLHRAGGAPHANRLTVIAGPKVYSSLKRRFSSLCFGTIKTPQNTGLSSEDAVMNPRDVARAARRSIDVAHERLGCGDALLVFAEGTRSRTSGLQQMLAAATRYLESSRHVHPAGGHHRHGGAVSDWRRHASLRSGGDATGPADRGRCPSRAGRRQSTADDGVRWTRYRAAFAGGVSRRVRGRHGTRRGATPARDTAGVVAAACR